MTFFKTTSKDTTRPFPIRPTKKEELLLDDETLNLINGGGKNTPGGNEDVLGQKPKNSISK